MLHGYDDGGRFLGYAVLVGDGHLCLAVGLQALDEPFDAGYSQKTGNTVGKHTGHGQHFRRFIGGVAIHDALIARSLVIWVVLGGDIHAVRDVLTLVMDENFHLIFFGVIAHGLYGLADDALNIWLFHGGDLTGYHDLARGRQHLAGDAGVFIFHEAFVEDGVRDQIAEFVWMPFAYGFSGIYGSFHIVSSIVVGI